MGAFGVSSEPAEAGCRAARNWVFSFARRTHRSERTAGCQKIDRGLSN